MDHLNWLHQVKRDTPGFLEHMKGSVTPGFYHYSLTGDLFDETEHWGLGNTVFAIKNYYSLGVLDTLKEQERQAMSLFIKSFQRKDGSIIDPVVKREAWVREKLSAIRHKNFRNFFHQQTSRAETRQSISALHLLNERPDLYPKFPNTPEAVVRYLETLRWNHPWGASSHFSHLLFFLAHSEHPQKEQLIDVAIHWINQLQHRENGAWYKGTPPVVQQINGAMKVFTGLRAANRLSFNHAEKLIDLALNAKDNRQACDNFNVIYVLKCAREATQGHYRNDEIQAFALDRLSIYRNYYWPEHGGFSFLPGKANHYYYKSIITKGLPEPDIHGTTLFLWGIAVIAQILEINDQFGFKEFAA
ncbi:hypothetical protein CO174_03940 [Candidatus Uhrbacteria bacterium CG_4_9_14_3_um_filter_50_9]|uniref:Uncharacterized protein n=1 Tax=Candidatus Uhrbacteria bacterium CG_4_9_14_3_um_filter_50_9 TaxID=1975035 RepID=A0A2M7XBN6_9BACT|nr:MAG: hypothetical protein CO174_03940 [Candidatus Uhrbacteria bacterium CG_4_9_14_3_um_filter_50_9]